MVPLREKVRNKNENKGEHLTKLDWKLENELGYDLKREWRKVCEKETQSHQM